MSRLSLFCIAVLCSTSCVVITGYNYPADRKQPCNCDRLSPIALLSSTAKPIWAPELVFTFSKDAEVRFINNGGAVLGNVVKGSINATGGPVYKDIYYLTEIIYRVDPVGNLTRVYGTIDGVGTALAYNIFFYNSAYPAAQIRQYYDGILNIAIPVSIEGTAKNPKFEKFAPVLENVRKFNSTYTTTGENSLRWLLETLQKNCYFSFPGSARNTLNAELSPSQIVVEPTSKKRPYISYTQFSETYLKVQNNFSQVLTNVLPTFSQGNRPLVEICSPVKINWHSAKGCGSGAASQKQESGNGYSFQSQYQG